MATYLVAVEGEGTVRKGLTLFEACNAVRGVTGGLVLREGATKSDNLVAFWSGYDTAVRPGFGVLLFEREELKTYTFYTEGR